MKTLLKNGEELILEKRPHWIVLVKPALMSLLAAIAGLVLGKMGIIIYIFAIAYFVYEMLLRNNNIWAITNLRVINENGVFSSNALESPLEKINNISYNQPFWGKIMGYGHVEIQTAAEVGATIYYYVENPQEVKDTITRMQEIYKENQFKNQASALQSTMFIGNNQSNIVTEIEKLHNLKQQGILSDEEFNTLKAKLLNS